MVRKSYAPCHNLQLTFVHFPTRSLQTLKLGVNVTALSGDNYGTLRNTKCFWTGLISEP